jgi:hypothetical protein
VWDRPATWHRDLHARVSLLHDLGGSHGAAASRHRRVEVDAARPRIALTGEDPARVREIVERQLGEGVDIDVLGDLPRRLEPRPCVGYMEREPGRLQLRFELGDDDHVDEIVVAEDEQAVVAFATVSTSTAGEVASWCQVPCHVYLERPLGDRTVIDGTSGCEVPYKNVYATLGRLRR